MKMNARIHIMLAFLLLLPATTFAKLTVTEVMYDVEGTDAGREWIEIYNDSDVDVTTKEITLFENNTHHKLDITENLIIPAHAYVVVADNKTLFLGDNSTYSGISFDSAFSLSNTGESLSLYLNGVVEDSASYTSSLGAGGNGNSLQKIGEYFIAAKPTPGAVNEENKNTESSFSSTSSTTTTTVSTSTPSFSPTQTAISTHKSSRAISSITDNKLKADVGRERMTTINTPLDFQGRMQVGSKEVEGGKYEWSFGDGTAAFGKEIEHIYQFPGEYNVVLNTYYEKTKAVSRTKVAVYNPEVTISQIDRVNGFVEIKNDALKEVNIGYWVIKGDNKTLIVIPKDTIISAKTSVKIPLLFESISVVTLEYPNKKVVTEVNLRSTEEDIFQQAILSLQKIAVQVNKL